MSSLSGLRVPPSNLALWFLFHKTTGSIMLLTLGRMLVNGIFFPVHFVWPLHGFSRHIENAARNGGSYTRTDKTDVLPKDVLVTAMYAEYLGNCSQLEELALAVSGKCRITNQ